MAEEEANKTSQQTEEAAALAWAPPEAESPSQSPPADSSPAELSPEASPNLEPSPPEPSPPEPADIEAPAKIKTVEKLTTAKVIKTKSGEVIKTVEIVEKDVTVTEPPHGAHGVLPHGELNPDFKRYLMAVGNGRVSYFDTWDKVTVAPPPPPPEPKPSTHHKHKSHRNHKHGGH